MYLSKLMVNKILKSFNLDKDKILDALKELEYKVISVNETCKENKGIEICHTGSSRKQENSDYYMCLVDIGDDLPVISLSYKQPSDQVFVLFAKNKAKVFSKGIIEPIRSGELKTDGHLCSLNDIGYTSKTYSKEYLEKIYEVYSDEELNTYYGKNNIIDVIGLNDVIFEIDTNESFYEIISNLAFFFRKKPVRSQDDELENLNRKSQIDISVDSKDIAVVGQQVVSVRKILEINETKWRIFSEDSLTLDKVGIKESDQFFTNISNLIEYETNVKVIFFNRSELGDNLTIKYDKKAIVIKNGEKQIYNNDGYTQEEYKPSKDSVELVAIYLFKNYGVSNQIFVKNRVGYWLNRYSISKNYGEILYSSEYNLTVKNINFNMSEINKDKEKKVTIRQITKLLRFFDIDLKEFHELNGEFIITNLNNKYNSLNDIYSLINSKLKLNKI